MKTLIMGDSHFGVHEDCEFYQEYKKKTFEWIADICVKNQIDRINHLGDFFDNRRSISYKTFKQTTDILNPFFDKINSTVKEFVYLAGNHDMFYKNSSEINSFRELFQNVPIENIDLKMVIDNAILFDDSLFVPWMYNDNREKILSQISEHKSYSKFLFGHFAINGFTLVPGIEERSGDEPTLYSDFKNVFSGHFHIRSEKQPIIYTGSVFQLNWNDADDIKGVYILNHCDDSVEFLASPYKVFSKILVRSDFDMDTINIGELKKQFVKLVILEEPNIKIERQISKLCEELPQLEIVNKYSVLSAENITIDKFEVNDIFAEYVETLKLESSRKKKILANFADVYTEALREI